MPPRPKPPKPNPELKTGPADEDKPMPAMPPPVPEPGGGVPILERPFFCRTYRLCPPAPPATVHLRSGRLPTPLVAASAALLAVSATLLLALLVRYLVRRWRRRRGEQQQEEEALRDDDDDDEESVQGVDSAARGAGEAEGVDSGGVHHVWYIRTKGLDERAIAAIAAVVYDASKRRAEGGGGCAVCLAEFRDGETLRLLPRCAHAFHRGCIDPWLRAHVNCPLCRAPVQAAEEAASAGTEGPQRRVPDRAVRRAASSMVAIPRRAWPDLPPQAPASSSGREEDTPGLAKISRLLKLSEALDLPGVAAGRSASFDAGSCRRFPTRSGPSTAAGVTGDETEPSR